MAWGFIDHTGTIIMSGVLRLREGDYCPATAGANRVFQPEVNSSAFQFILMHSVDLLSDWSCDPFPPLAMFILEHNLH